MNYDILIIGTGPAGQHAAWQAARMGKRAAIIERKPKIGGAGLQTGTIPSKAMREVAYLLSRTGGMRQAVAPDARSRHGLLADAVRRKEGVIAQQESVILQRLLSSGVALIPGEASFVDPNKVEVVDTAGNTRQITADVIVLATGSRPRRPINIPFDKKTVLDSTSILNLRHLPDSLLVVGGGVIGCEFVSIFAALGVQVSVVDNHEQLLDYLSEDVVGVLTESFLDMGVTFHMKERVAQIRREENSTLTLLESGKQIRTDAVLYAQGREPNSEGQRAAHLCRGRSDRPTRFSLDRHGTGARRGAVRLWWRHTCRGRKSADGGLHHPGNLLRRQNRKGSPAGEYTLRGRTCPFQGQCARTDHRRRARVTQADRGCAQ
jgi:NAD(P) transhydrogenase